MRARCIHAVVSFAVQRNGACNMALLTLAKLLDAVLDEIDLVRPGRDGAH